MHIARNFFIAASGLMMIAHPALAQTAPEAKEAAEGADKAAVTATKKKQAAKAGNATAVTIVNARNDDILAVSAQAGARDAVSLLKKPLSPGKKQTVKLPGSSGCEFTVTARFADGSEFEPTPVNLCHDKTIRFTDEGAPAETAAPAEE